MILSAATLILSTVSPAKAVETMTDRCGAEVAIVPTYSSQAGTKGTVFLKRRSDGTTAWTHPFRVKLDDDGHIRWWCHSTTRNWLDPGTWGFDDVDGGVVCDVSADGSAPKCHVNANIKVDSKAWQGWTAERSRCDDHSSKIRARLPDGSELRVTWQVQGNNELGLPMEQDLDIFVWATIGCFKSNA